jgi:hypothetical protein
MIIAFFWLFLLPESTYACALHSKETVKKEMSCCITKEKKQDKHQDSHSDQSEDKDCCDTQHDDNHKCAGACGSQSCHSTTFSFTATPPLSKNTHCDLTFQQQNL